MPDPGASDPQPRARTAQEVFRDFLVRRGSGEDIAIEDLCANRPDLAAELTQMWLDHQRATVASKPPGEQDTLSNELRARFGNEPAPTVSLTDIESHEVDPLPQVAAMAPGEAPTGTRFRIDSEIARGGMGAVFKAWDKDLRRSLAMKLALRDGNDIAGTASTSKLTRFVEEAQITGQLDHPGIVPVHEMGIDEAGRVFFTMRLVRGRDLKRVFELSWKNEEGWTQTRVLHLMLKVLEALAYAHNKGVIHRDLKPANVMVGRFGEAYVMDWGIARVIGKKDKRDLRIKMGQSSLSGVATDRREQAVASPESALVTMDGEVLGTPAYMPPEQARSEHELMSARSDVYSVGAMLYHLLTQQTPFVPPGARITPWMILTRVLEEKPKPILEINPDAPPELVAICEKAMKREAEDRYPSAEAMREDLEAFLENRVVTAYEVGVVAEVRKWVSRNKALAGALLLVAVISLGALGVFTYTQNANAKTLEAKNKDLTAATNLAEHKAEEAKQTLELFTGMFEEQEPTTAKGRKLTVLEVMDTASAAFLKESDIDPEVRSKLLTSIALVVHNQGGPEKSAALYEKAFEVSSKGLGETDPVSLNALTDLIGAKMELAQLDEALRLALHRLELLKSNRAPDDTKVLEAECLLAGIYNNLERWDDAEKLFQHVITAQRGNEKLLTNEHLNAARNLAMMWSGTGRIRQAIEFMSDWAAKLEHAEKTGPTSRFTMDAWDSLGHLCGSDKQYAKAIDVLQRSAEARAKLPEKEGGGTDSYAYLQTTALIGRWMVESKRLDEAVPVLRSALAGLEQMFKPSHDQTDDARLCLARALLLQGNAQESEPLLQALARKEEKRYAAGVEVALDALANLVKAEIVLGKSDEASAATQRLLDHAVSDGFALPSLEHLVRVERDLGCPEVASKLMQLLLNRAGPASPKAAAYDELKRSIGQNGAEDH